MDARDVQGLISSAPLVALLQSYRDQYALALRMQEADAPVVRLLQRLIDELTATLTVAAEEEYWLDPAETGRHLKQRETAVRRLCRREEIPGAKRVGIHWRIPRDYVDGRRSA